MGDTAVDYYWRRMRDVQRDYERCLSEPRECLATIQRFHMPTYVLHDDGTLEARNNYTPEMEEALKQARRITEEIHAMFREPMRQAAENYQRAIAEQSEATAPHSNCEGD